ncbi:MAG: DNRLRE domain-containing protein [Pirellulales bacterium]
MLRNLCAVLVLLAVASPAAAQLSATFQQGVDGYAGTVDTTFRANRPLGEPNIETGVTPDQEQFISVDEYDEGFQTQGALRFENLFGNQPGQVPAGLTITFATLTVRVTSASDPEAILSFNRVLPASPWTETSTWFSLGGDLIPDEGGLLDGDPILQNNVESLTVPDAVVPTPNVSNAFVDLDVTTSIKAWYAGAQNLGWGINNNTGNGWDFDSSEWVNPLDAADFSFRPKLTIGYVTTLGDFDLDSDVDLTDYDFLLGNLAVQLNGPINQGSHGDLDNDRDVDLDDFGIFKGLYPGGAGALAAALTARSAVPEPATGVMVMVAIAAGFSMGGRGRRRANRQGDV